MFLFWFHCLFSFSYIIPLQKNVLLVTNFSDQKWLVTIVINLDTNL